jgi:excisionase family DNA binding protein
MTAVTEGLMKVPAVAARLGLGHTATRALISSGSIPSLRVGPGARSIRVSSQDLDLWIEAQIRSSNEYASEGQFPEASAGHLHVHRASW